MDDFLILLKIDLPVRVQIGPLYHRINVVVHESTWSCLGNLHGVVAEAA